MKRISFLLLLMSLIVTSCKKEDEVDKTPPATVTGITAVPMNGSIKISWTNPVDEDFTTLKITYGTVTLEADKSVTEKIIEGLDNGTEYTFAISTVDKLGNASEAATIKVTPDKYVTKIASIPVASGNYTRIKAPFPVTITINNSQYKNVMEAGGTQFIWEGSWSNENDTTYKFDYVYHTIDFRGDRHVANMIVRKNAVLSYVYADSTIYSENAYEKMEGSSDFLPGKYRYYIKTVSSDTPSYNDTTYYAVTISQDGKITYGDSNETSTWDNNDLKKGRFLFVTSNSRTYLIMADKTIRYHKK